MTLKDRINVLKEKMLATPRYVSIEQAKITTKVYKENEGKPVILKRALALKCALEELTISIEPGELIVGNRTVGPRYGVVTPEGGSSWLDKEFDTLPTRPQDKFQVHQEDMEIFRNEILPYWKGKSLEDVINDRFGEEISAIKKVVKINQTDHAQGHICPDCETWLKLGPLGLKKMAEEKYSYAQEEETKVFYLSVLLVMEGVSTYMRRYSALLTSESAKGENIDNKETMLNVADICKNLSIRPPETFHEAVQSIWFLFVILHMESNASSFSPERMDRFLYSYYERDLKSGKLSYDSALEIIECLWLKFNQIVYLRNSGSAKYFAGFPIGFNIVVGGQDENGSDFSNELSHMLLDAQADLLLPQPNLSVRLHEKTNNAFLTHAVRVVAKGSGMPQFFNDDCIIPSLKKIGIEEEDALNYAVVGCVELTTQGNNLGWSDAAMFNLNKALELTINSGMCLLTNKKIGLDLGSIETYTTYEQLELAFKKQIEYFVARMITACEEVEKAHIELLPTPFLSAVIKNCMDNATDVTAGGAKYNYSGIQMIQIANLADSLAAIKKLVYDDKKINSHDLLSALKNNFKEDEIIRAMLLNKAPKYGNDVKWVDDIGNKWANFFKEQLMKYENYRGGIYHTGMYTVSAHVPMGENVGASPDGRYAETPLADGGMSPVYGRDINGPTAVFNSVSRLDDILTSNGGLLNMKFLPEFFNTETGIKTFVNFLRTFTDLHIPHIQFNVLRKEDMLAAQKNPELYRNLTVRVAGYTAYFTELAGKLQDEIIARTSYGEI